MDKGARTSGGECVALPVPGLWCQHGGSMSSWASPFSLVQALLPLCSAIGFERVSIVVLSARDPERREAGKAPCLLPRDHTP